MMEQTKGEHGSSLKPVDWRGKSGDLFKIIGATGHSKQQRAEHDYYATDPMTIVSLFSQEQFADKIWEPACGEGHLSKMMRWKYRKAVRESDVVDRMGNEVLDFLKLDSAKQHWDGDIITNPPYKYAKEFVEKALDIIYDGHKVAMFLKLTFLEGQQRRQLFAKAPPKTVYVFSKRQLCARNGDFDTYKANSCVCYAWFVWVKGFRGDPVIRWI